METGTGSSGIPPAAPDPAVAPAPDPAVAPAPSGGPDSSPVAQTPPPVSSDPNELLRQIAENQAAQRTEIAQLQDAINKQRQVPVSGPTANAPTPEVAAANRQDEVAQFDFYCPGCGKLLVRAGECVGKAEAPHPPIEAVSTDELKNAPDPETDPQGYAKWQASHTAAPTVPS